MVDVTKLAEESTKYNPGGRTRSEKVANIRADIAKLEAEMSHPGYSDALKPERIMADAIEIMRLEAEDAKLANHNHGAKLKNRSPEEIKAHIAKLESEIVKYTTGEYSIATSSSHMPIPTAPRGRYIDHTMPYVMASWSLVFVLIWLVFYSYKKASASTSNS